MTAPVATLPALYTDPVKFAALDTETWLIEPGLLAPPLVCGSMARLVRRADRFDMEAMILGKRERDPELSDVIEVFTSLLCSDTIIVGANIAYDMLVLAVFAQGRGIDLCPMIVDAYEADRVYDVQLAEAEHGIGRGLLGRDLITGTELTSPDPKTGNPKPTKRYSLANCVLQVLGREDAKENSEWRLRYAELDPHPIRTWPEKARVYPVDDVKNPLEVALAQCGYISSRDAHDLAPDGVCRRCDTYPDTPACFAARPRFNLHDVPAQTRKAMALHSGAAWGLRAVRSRVEALAAAAAGGADCAPFIAAGFLRGDGSEDQAVVKRACAIAYGAGAPCSECHGAGKVPSPKTGNPINCKKCSGTMLDLDAAPSIPRTDGGSVSISRDALGESGDELLMAYGESAEDDKITSTYVPTLLRACEVPLNLRPNPLLDTGRVSYSGTEQTFPRQVSAHLSERLKVIAGAPVGVRDCFEAREGWVYYSVDYTGGELVTWAESAVERVGFSDLGAALVAGLDAHSAFAGTMLGRDYDAFIKALKVDKERRAKDARQAAKPANFGFPGGMGAWKLVLQQRKQGPDTPHPSGPSKVWDGKAWVPGYKGLRFCVLIGGASACGEAKVTEWKGREGPPTCRRCIECAEMLKDTWLRQWREAKPYLKWHADNSDQHGWVEQIYSRRRRGGTDYCSEANGDFQALLADIAYRAQWRVWREQVVRTRVEDETSAYHGQESPLWGSRGILAAHDEQLGECRVDMGHDVAMRVLEVMVAEFVKGCPRHAKACKAEPTLMRAWHKAAEPKYREGRLVAWDS